MSSSWLGLEPSIVIESWPVHETGACYVAGVGGPSELKADASAPVESSALVIATWQRPQLLQNALTGVRAQSRPFDEVLISVRPEDSASREVIATTRGLPIREIFVNRPSAVAARTPRWTSQQATFVRTSMTTPCLLQNGTRNSCGITSPTHGLEPSEGVTASITMAN